MRSTKEGEIDIIKTRASMSPRRLSFAITVVVAAHSSTRAAAESIYDIANRHSNLTTLVAALNAVRGYDGGGTGLVDVLSGDGTFTLFGE